YAMEYYRRYILPDLVRYYRGVFARRQIDPSSAFGDLVFAQQNLTTNVTAYIGILGSLWSSVVSVADFLQTDDLFQMGKPRELPELPDFSQLPHWACEHAALAASCADGGTAFQAVDDHGQYARATTTSGTAFQAVDDHGQDARATRGPSAAAPGAGSPPSGPADRVPAGPPGSETGRPPSPAGDGGASVPQSPGEQPPAAPQFANPADRPPSPPSGPQGDATARLDRWRDPDISPAALLKSYFGKGANRGAEA